MYVWENWMDKIISMVQHSNDQLIRMMITFEL